MRGAVVTEQKLGQARCPVPLLGSRQGTQQVVKGAIESLALAISGRVVGSCARLMRPIKDTES